jgi:hypothetical protein
MIEEYIVVVKCEELIGTTEYLTLWTGYRLNRYRYNRVCLYTKLYPVRNASKNAGTCYNIAKTTHELENEVCIELSLQHAISQTY